MNPLRFQNEEEYYERILEKFMHDEASNQIRNFETFASKEIITVLSELKHEELDVEKIQNIAKNTIILILSLFTKGGDNNFSNFNELEENDRGKIKKELLPIICN